MNLNTLTVKPQLIEISIDDEDTIKELGEPITFYTWDRQPLDVFMRLASADHNNTGSVIGIVRTLILDEQGKEIIKEDAMLPTNILMKAISKVTDLLGK